jgi:dihydrofolate reductase
VEKYMKVALVIVSSLDGRTTEGNSPGTQTWASAEDQILFAIQRAAHDRIVMGSKTYETARSLITPDPRRPRIVMTRTPQKFTAEQQPGLSFTADDPGSIIAEAKASGCKTLLLAGGAETSAHFLDAGLVDELHVTVEPLLFGAGAPFVAALQRSVTLRLIDHKLLNHQGTLWAHYRVQKAKPGACTHENTKV